MALRKSLGFLNIKPLIRCQTASMISKMEMDTHGPRPNPFPYEKSPYTALHSIFDKTTWRFDDNTKVIIVDGPVASGKAKFAKTIAERFDMQYIPHASQDTMYIDYYGFDHRTLEDQISEDFKCFSIEDFLKNPKSHKTQRLQMEMLRIRLSDYLNALTHLFSTGQGIVLNRSVYSDFVFLETLVKFGFVSKDVQTYYYEVKYMFISQILRPHLVIYLDVPVNVVLQRIKERNRPGEKDSPFYKPEILAYMENVYKQRYLKSITNHAELLAYDWSEGGDPEMVIDDIEKVNLDNYPFESEKMFDWRMPNEDEWCIVRRNVSYHKDSIMRDCMLPIPYGCPELYYEADDIKKYQSLLGDRPGSRFVEGFEPTKDPFYKVLFNIRDPPLTTWRKNF